MNIPRAELLHSIPLIETYSVQGGKLYVFNQSLHPLTSPKALVEQFSRQHPLEIKGVNLSGGVRANKGFVRHVTIGDDELVLKRDRHTLQELREIRHRWVKEEREEPDVTRRRKLHGRNVAKMRDAIHVSSPVRQLVAYYDTVAVIEKVCKKRGWDIKDVWSMEVPLAYFKADKGDGWFAFNYIPPAVKPRSGTEDVTAYFKAENDRFPELLLFWAGVEIKDRISYIITGNPQQGYRKILVDTEMLMKKIVKE